MKKKLPAVFLDRRVQSQIVLALTLAVLVLGNLLGTHVHRRWDFTRTKLYSLSGQSKKILNGLSGDVEAYYFYKETPYDAQADILREFAKESRRFRLHLTDLDKRPEVARAYHVNDYNTLVLTYGGRQKRVSYPEETDVTNALLRLVRNEQKKVFLTFGNGERSMRNHDRDGFSRMAALLERENYRIDSLALAVGDRVPDDCDVLVVNGLTKPWTQHERNLVADYANRGGRIFLNLDDSLSGTNALLGTWGLAMENAAIIDLTASLFGVSPGITALVEYADHEITADFRLMTAFELPRPIRVFKTGEGLEPVEFLRSSERSWADRDTKAKKFEYREGIDVKGPWGFGVALESKRTKSRIAVIGDSEYASNAYESFSGNADLYLNTLAWLTSQEDLISIRSKEMSHQKLNLTQTQAALFFGLAIFVIPFAVAATGVFVWIRRRRNA